MKLSLSVFNTLPKNQEDFWKIVVFPTVSILRRTTEGDEYTAINAEWLFWSMTILIENDKGTISKS